MGLISPKLQIEITTYKKFRTEYRPFMIKVKAELCHELSMKNHPNSQLFNGGKVNGTLMEPCPLSVIKTLI